MVRLRRPPKPERGRSMFRRLAVVIGVMVAVSALPVAAQEEMPQAKKFDNPNWYYLIHVQFESGKADEAVKMLKEHFFPAGEAAGVKMPKIFRTASGEWDLIMLFHLEEGISELDWEVTPSDLKWYQAFIELEGDMEAAQKIFDEYDDMIERWNVELIRYLDLKPPKEDAAE